MKRALLLDMDGVVFHQPRVSKQIAHRISRLVQRTVLPPGEQSPEFRNKAYRINEGLYGVYGHTLIGMNDVYGSGMNLDEFNRHVYSRAMLRYMARSADLEMRLRGDDLARLLVRATMMGAPIYIFSNAPKVWCDAILAELGLDGYIPDWRIIGCDHPIFKKGALMKPHPLIYPQMSLLVQKEFPGQTVVKYFVDDSLVNLRPIRDDAGWVPIWFSPASEPWSGGGSRPDENRNICHAMNMSHVGDYLELM